MQVTRAHSSQPRPARCKTAARPPRLQAVVDAWAGTAGAGGVAARLERDLVSHLDSSLRAQLQNAFRAVLYGSRQGFKSHVSVLSVREAAPGRVEFVAEARTFHPTPSGHATVSQRLLVGTYGRSSRVVSLLD
ncbi:MAG: hypothetical protein VKS61_05390 [Candidatus Sericytochromatia bacterium]|nr:hypothetical protein [Candidatus Sericytochromatia bacterium]